MLTERKDALLVMSKKIDVNINQKKVEKKVTNDKFGKFVSNEWKRLVDPYTPRDTGLLMQNVAKLPFKLHYKQPYAAHVYYMKNAEFKHKNPYSTYEWDKAAAQAGQKAKLYKTMNAALKSGRFNGG